MSVATMSASPSHLQILLPRVNGNSHATRWQRSIWRFAIYLFEKTIQGESGTRTFSRVGGKAPTEAGQRRTWRDQSRAIRYRIETFKLERL
jgi:hypothetical protein